MNGTLPQTEDLTTFVTIADAGSINGAARTLQLPKSTLSRRLARLEETVGVRLFVRNRQRLSLSEAGSALLEQAKRTLSELRSFADAASRSQAEPQGRLRVSIPRDLAGYADVWLDFIEHYPLVALETELTNRYVDVVREGFDVALRGGRGEDETLVAKRLGSYALVAVASPGYVERWGMLQEATELRAHSCVLLSAMQPRQGFPLRPSPPHRHILFNDAELVRQAVVRGQGIGILPPPVVAADLRAKRLVKILKSYDPLEVPLYAVYPDRAYLRAAVSAFLEFTHARFRS